jgi:hypothetical protein
MTVTTEKTARQLLSDPEINWVYEYRSVHGPIQWAGYTSAERVDIYQSPYVQDPIYELKNDDGLTPKGKHRLSNNPSPATSVTKNW